MNATAYIASPTTVRVRTANKEIEKFEYTGGAEGARKALAARGYKLAESWDWTDSYGGALTVAVTR